MTTTTESKPTWLIAKVFLLLATGGASYLLFVALKDGHVAGCGSGSSCDSVLKSRWAYILPGVPVTVPALLTYLILLFGAFFKRGSELWKGIMLVAALTVIGSAFWFVGLQIIELGAFCKWCMGTHLCGVIGCVFLLKSLSPVPKELKPLALGVAGLSLSALAMCQLILPQATTSETDLGSGSVVSDGQVVTILGNEIDIDTMPSLGDPDSEKVMIMFFDYTCGSCRRMHGYIAEALERYTEQSFRVVLVPTPLNPDCNRYFEQDLVNHRGACTFAQLAHALWLIDQPMFREFDKWMITSGGGALPKIDEARGRAAELVGQEALNAALGDPRIEANIELAAEIYNSLKKRAGGAMPKIIFGNSKMLEGATDGEDALFEILESELGLTPMK